MVGRSRVVVVSRAGTDSMPEQSRRALEAVAEVTYVVRDRSMSKDDARLALRGAAVVAATPLVVPQFDRRLLHSLPNLRGLAMYATGYDYLDVELLTEFGVTVSLLPHFATESVAEHAIAMLLGLSCRVHLANDRSRGMTPADVSLRGFELRGRTLGVIGTGRIGSRVAELARAFGMRVLGHDPGVRLLPGVEQVGLRELLMRSDAVVLCCPYERGAPPVLGARELGWCRQGAVVVNISRPTLVDNEAVAIALRTRRLRGYAVDDAVFGLDAYGDLVREGRVLQTGHSAWWRDEALARGGVMWAEQIRRLAIGDPVDVIVPRPRVERLAG